MAELSGLDSEDSVAQSDTELHSILPHGPAESASSMTASEALQAGERRRAQRRRRRSAQRSAPQFEYVGDDAFAVTTSAAGELGGGENTDGDESASATSAAESSSAIDYKLIVGGDVVRRHNSLEILARNAVPSSKARFSAFLYYVVEACERVSREQRAQTNQTVMHLRVILARLDTHALLYRPRIAGTDPRFMRGDSRLCDLLAHDAARDRAHFLDRPHQETLFAARCSVLSALSVLVAHSNATDARLVFRRPPAADHYETVAYGVDEYSLARWLQANDACDASALTSAVVVSRQAGGSARTKSVVTHRLHECSIDTLWRSILALMRVWPQLPLSAELTRYVDELRLRVAYFLSYRERLGEPRGNSVAKQLESGAALVEQRAANYWRRPARPTGTSASSAGGGGTGNTDDELSSGLSSSLSSDESDSASGHDRMARANNRTLRRAKQTLLGLNAELFGLRDMRGAADQELLPETRSGERSTLIDNIDFMALSGAYKHANFDFLDECERVLHELQRQLRQCAGFAHEADLCASQRVACLCCRDALHSSARVVSDAHVARLAGIVDDQLSNSMTTFIDERFKRLVFDDYMQPSEMETFIEMYAREVHTALNCTAKLRAADYRVMTKRFTSLSCDAVWRDDLRDAPHEPAHALLALLALDYHMRQNCDGAAIGPYVLECSQLEAHPFVRRGERVEDFGRVDRLSSGMRAYGGELFEVGFNAGTFRYRHQMLRAQGGEADELFAHYEHPVVLRMLNGYTVLYNSHVHECGTFLHAFATWLLLMCLDPHIRGYTASGSPLHGVAATVFPERVDELLRVRTDAERKRAEWSAVNKITPPALVDITGAGALAEAAANDGTRKRRRKQSGGGDDSDLETQF